MLRLIKLLLVTETLASFLTAHPVMAELSLLGYRGKS